jgi:hypothetical protein
VGNKLPHLNRNLIVTLDAQKNSLERKLSQLGASSHVDSTELLRPQAHDLLQMLVAFEQRVVDQIVSNLNGNKPLNQLGMGAHIKSILGIGFNIDEVKSNAKSNLSIEELLRQWSEVRNTLDEIDLLEDRVLKKGVYTHPGFGCMNFEHVLRLLTKNYNKFISEFSNYVD